MVLVNISYVLCTSATLTLPPVPIFLCTLSSLTHLPYTSGVRPQARQLTPAGGPASPPKEK